VPTAAHKVVSDVRFCCRVNHGDVTHGQKLALKLHPNERCRFGFLAQFNTIAESIRLAFINIDFALPRVSHEDFVELVNIDYAL